MKTAGRIWMITGVSGGLGKAIAKEAAENHDSDHDSFLPVKNRSFK